MMFDFFEVSLRRKMSLEMDEDEYNLVNTMQFVTIEGLPILNILELSQFLMAVNEDLEKDATNTNH